MARKFMFDGRELPDPDPSASIDEVRDTHAEFLPELFNATHAEKKNGDDTVITFTKNVGKKGAAKTAPDNVITTERFLKIMGRVPAKELKLITLTNELTGPDGQIDFIKAAERAPEINLARAEAMAYVRATEHAAKAIENIKPRKGLSR